MENNNYNYQQNQPYQFQAVDPNYSETVKGFLTRAIVMGAVSSLPVGSIIAIFKAKKNREDVLDYINKKWLPHAKLQLKQIYSMWCL